MKNIAPKISQLRKHLESTAFLVSRGHAEKEAHSEIVRSLVILSEIETALLEPETRIETAAYSAPARVLTSINSDKEEVKKVSRRLRLWAKRQYQINSRILNAFLKLQSSGQTTITENDIKRELPDESSFESNFAQMKNFGEKNHGKVFDQYGENIAIWEPVLSDVREYERVVFGNK